MLIRWTGILLVATAAFCGAVAARDTMTRLQPAADLGEVRHALVIGNANYTHGPLKNPLNDARAMAKELAQAGFEVLLVEDATQTGMQKAVRTFGDRLASGGVGLFYYAGHGIQAKGRNYLVPVNADIDREYEIEFTSVDMNMVLSMMDAAKNPLNIVILDACRNNPFSRSFRISATGLAPMDAPSGTFIAFATSPGAIASDGAGANGIYTKHLLAQIGRPGVPIEQLFKQVRIGVMSETQGEQTPWESSSLRGEFAFRPGATAASQANVAATMAEALERARQSQRQETEQLVVAALERQRIELETQGLRLRPEPAAVSEAPLTASTANRASAGGVSVLRLPTQGDTWTYRLNSPGAKQRSYVVSVIAASPRGILDRLSIEAEPQAQVAHSPGRYLLAQGPSLFSPYFTAFARTAPRGPVEIRDQVACTMPYGCTARVRSVTSERVVVPAGIFQAVKVVIEHDWYPQSIEPGASAMNNERWGSRTLTVWYAEETKRAVRFSSRLERGRAPPIDPNFDLELVSYEVN